jgi:hypothetical protein
MRDASPRDLCDLGGWSSYDVPMKCYIKPSIEASAPRLRSDASSSPLAACERNWH